MKGQLGLRHIVHVSEGSGHNVVREASRLQVEHAP